MFPPTYGLLKLAQQFEEPRSREPAGALGPAT